MATKWLKVAKSGTSPLQMFWKNSEFFKDTLRTKITLRNLLKEIVCENQNFRSDLTVLVLNYAEVVDTSNCRYPNLRIFLFSINSFIRPILLHNKKMLHWFLSAARGLKAVLGNVLKERGETKCEVFAKSDGDCIENIEMNSITNISNLNFSVTQCISE